MNEVAAMCKMCNFQIMNATLTDLRNPKPLLKAADAGEPVVITDHGIAAYELRKVSVHVDWDALEAGRDNWLSEEESAALENAINRSATVLTHDTVP